MEASVREEIMAYATQVRGLTEETIGKAIREKIPRRSFRSVQCDRCGSDKLVLETYRKSCMVCGYTTSRREWLRLIGKLLDGFG